MFDPLKPYATPEQWTADHVLVRLKWAFQALDRLNIRIYPAGFKSNWPSYLYEFADLVSQEEAPIGADKSEAENMRLNSASNTRLRVPPSAREISMMEEAFQWPVEFLKSVKRPHIAAWAWAVTRDRTPHHWIKMERVYIEAGQIVVGLRERKAPIR